MASTEVLKPSKQLAVNNLFRFINYADPKAVLPPLNANYGILQNASAGDSVFLTAVDGLETQEEIDTAIAGVMETFTPITTVQAVTAVNSGLYAFGGFTARYSSSVSHAAVQARVTSSGATSLAAAEKNTLWDNLYYQAIKSGPSLVADAIVQLLRADAFYSEFQSQTGAAGSWEEWDDEELADNQDKLQRTSTATVVIPIVLVNRKDADPLPDKNDLDVDSKEALARKNNADKARYEINKMQRALGEILLADTKYNQETAAEYKDNYDEFIEKLRAGVAPAPGERTNYNFTAQDPLRTEFIDANLSDGAKIYFNLARHSTHKNLRDIAQELESRLRSEHGKLKSNADIPDTKIHVNGSIVTISKQPKNNTFVVTSHPKAGSNTLYQFFFTQYFESAETMVTGIEVTATNAASVEFNAKTSTPFYRTDKHVTYLLFEEGLEKEAEGYDLEISYKVETARLSKDVMLPAYKFEYPLYGNAAFGAATEPELTPETDLEPGNSDVRLYGVKRIGVMEYKRVEQRVCCYVAGEVSHIENIMAREYKEKASRTLTRSETTQEDIVERESEKTTDTTSTERHEMSTEISQVIQEEQSRQIGVNAGVNASYNSSPWSVSVNASTNMNFTNSSARTGSISTSEAFAKEIVERATQRLVEKVSSKRISRMLREYEETNKHGFDNRLGDKHVVGIYRWVDKIMENNLINYGKRLLYDFVLPEPSKNFKSWMEEKAKSAQVINIKAPKKPKEFGIELTDLKDNTGKVIGSSEWLSITEFNYADAAAEYGADVDPCPDRWIYVGKSFSEHPSRQLGNEGWGEKIGVMNDEIDIPDGYACRQFWGIYSHVTAYITDSSEPDGARSEAVVQVDTSHYWFRRHWDWHLCFNYDRYQDPNGYISDQTNFQNNNPDTRVYKKLPVSVSTYNVGGFSLNIVAGCERTEEAYRAWQQASYIAIVSAYNKKLEEYNNAVAVAQQGQNVEIDYSFNPLKGRAIEQRELRRMCIELMLEPFGLRSGRDNYVQDPCTKVYHVRKDQNFENHADYVRFMEEAFQWDLMSYYFYPYYWGSEFEWKDLINEKSSADPLFEAFLQSGMARVTLPVRINYEFAVAYFLNTGKLWKSNSAVAAGENKDLYLSIDSLLRYDEGKPEATWHTRIPTDLTILQNDASPLNEQGLPCEYVWKDGKKVYCENGEPIANDPTTVLSGINSGVINGVTSTFTFTKHPTLLLTDIGKLVVNQGDGLAIVSNLSPELPEQKGKFVIKLANLTDLQDSSELEFDTSVGSWSFSRVDWRMGSTPASVLEEYGLIKAYMDAQPYFAAFLTVSIVANDLVIEETTMNNTRIDSADFPDGSIEVDKVSRPISPAAVTGFPLGKLVGIDGNNAIISNEVVETYMSETPIAVNNALFNSDLPIDFYDQATLLSVLQHIMVAGADGKVRPAMSLTTNLDDSFLPTYRSQIVGIAIAAAGTEVKVIKLAYASTFFHFFRVGRTKGLFNS